MIKEITDQKGFTMVLNSREELAKTANFTGDMIMDYCLSSTGFCREDTIMLLMSLFQRTISCVPINSISPKTRCVIDGLTATKVTGTKLIVSDHFSRC